MTAAELRLLLSADVKNVDALAALVGSGDLRMVTTEDGLTVIRTHANIVTKLETGSALPLLAPTYA